MALLLLLFLPQALWLDSWEVSWETLRLYPLVRKTPAERDKSCLVPWSLQSSNRSWSPQTYKTLSTLRDAVGPQLSLLSAPTGLSQHHWGMVSLLHSGKHSRQIHLCFVVTNPDFVPARLPALNLPVLIQSRKNTFCTVQRSKKHCISSTAILTHHLVSLSFFFF